MNSKKFTIIELLVVIAIIGILASILLPALSKARIKVKTSVCLANIKQVQLGVTIYASEMSGLLPGPLLSNVQPAYTQGNYKLVPYIAEYVGYPKASSSTEIMTILDCPGFTTSISGADSVNCVLFKNLGKASNGERYFGYPNVSAPKFIAQLEEPTKENSLMEVDALYQTSSANASPQGRHGTKGGNFIRTRLFWDGHASASIDPKKE